MRHQRSRHDQMLKHGLGGITGNGRTNPQPRNNLPETMGSGVALFDYDNDQALAQLPKCVPTVPYCAL
jgi:hypothetical protein